MKHLRLFAGFAFAAAALFGSGCSDSDDLEPVMHAEAVQLDKTTLSLEIGSTEQLVATVLPEEADNKEVEWSTSDPEVATVDATGLVTAVGEGTATVTVTTVDGGITATCEVTVTAPAQVVAEGDTGSLHWVFYDDGLLRFTGTGDIPDYNAMSMGADRLQRGLSGRRRLGKNDHHDTRDAIAI